MIREAIQMLDLALFGEIALVIFVGVFILWTVWAMRQSRQRVRRWAIIPLDDGHAEPVRVPSREEGGVR